MDFAHNETEKKLKKLEKEIDALYRQALREIKVELEKYPSWDRILSIKDKKERLRKAKRRSDFQQLISKIAQIIQSKNKIADDMIQERIIEIFILNYEWEAYNIEKNSLINLFFTVYTFEVVKKMLNKKIPIFTKIAYKHSKDIKPILSDLKREIYQAVKKGYSINEISKVVSKVTGKNSFNSRRIARTETTRIQNSGRLSAIEHGINKGLKLKKQWISTIDSRTRDNHLDLNLKIVNVDEEFGFGLRYPGDPKASAKEVCNCRCTMVSIFDGLEPEANELEMDAKLRELTFKEWKRRNKN